MPNLEIHFWISNPPPLWGRLLVIVFFFLAALAFAFPLAFARLCGFVIFKRSIRVVTSLFLRFPVTKFFESFQLRAMLLRCGNRKFSFRFLYLLGWSCEKRNLGRSRFRRGDGFVLDPLRCDGFVLNLRYNGLGFDIYRFGKFFQQSLLQSTMRIPSSSLGGGSPPVMEVGICLSLSANSRSSISRGCLIFYQQVCFCSHARCLV